MKADQFKNVVDAQIKRVHDVLVVKTAEYGVGDKLRNCKQVALLRGVGLPQAISGAMAKHTVSIYDMIESGEAYPTEMWDEKITDHIVWLILLKAALIENVDNPQMEMT